MHRLYRDPDTRPTCLAGYRHGAQMWNDLDPAHRDEIRRALEQMQGRRCAYCESELPKDRHHIEHFRPRSRYPALTFEWDNLFWSCDRPDCCGHHKDGGAGRYEPNDLINPAEDDPHDFFLFDPYGTVHIRDGLTTRDRHRASETLRVFNLNGQGDLRQMRARAVRFYINLDPDIIDVLRESPEEEARRYIEDELERTAHDPFCTVIRHLLEELV